MPVYRLSAPITVSAYTDVEAKSPEEAKKIARERTAAIGGRGTGCDPDEYWIIDDADGEPDAKFMYVELRD